MSHKILLIEDDASISSLVKLNLKESGYEVSIVDNGSLAVEEFAKIQPDLVVVDLMLPGLDGKEVIRQIRSINSDIPILITTVKCDLMHKIIGFEIGADDYLSKPFEILELLARIKSLLKRRLQKSAESDKRQDIVIGNIKVDTYRHKVYLKEKEVDLSPKLFDLLVFLMQSPGKAYSRAELLSRVWEYDHEGYEHTVDTHVNRLRSRIEPNPGTPCYIITVWGVGYRFAEAHELESKAKHSKI